MLNSQSFLTDAQLIAAWPDRIRHDGIPDHVWADALRSFADAAINAYAAGFPRLLCAPDLVFSPSPAMLASIRQLPGARYTLVVDPSMPAGAYSIEGSTE